MDSRDVLIELLRQEARKMPVDSGRFWLQLFSFLDQHLLKRTSIGHLAPDIQEAILFLPLTFKGRDPIREAMIRPIALEPDWHKQRQMWKCLVFDQQVDLSDTE